MRTIWKYPLEVTDRQVVSMPHGARILAVQVQGMTPCLWALVNTDAPKVDIEIRIHGTGHELPDDCNQYQHIGTYQLGDGMLVFHVFRVLSPVEMMVSLL